MRKYPLRDVIGWKLSNLALRIATKRYRDNLDYVIRLGLEASIEKAKPSKAEDFLK